MKQVQPRRKTPCFRWQGISNLRPSTWKSQAQTTVPPQRVDQPEFLPDQEWQILFEDC